MRDHQAQQNSSFLFRYSRICPVDYHSHPWSVVPLFKSFESTALLQYSMCFQPILTRYTTFCTHFIQPIPLQDSRLNKHLWLRATANDLNRIRVSVVFLFLFYVALFCHYWKHRLSKAGVRTWYFFCSPTVSRSVRIYFIHEQRDFQKSCIFPTTFIA